MILLCFALLSSSIISGRAAKQTPFPEKLKNSLKKNANKDSSEPKYMANAGNDSTLQITADGSQHQHKQIKLLKDGQTYKTADTYEVLFNDYRVSSLYVFFSLRKFHEFKSKK